MKFTLGYAKQDITFTIDNKNIAAVITPNPLDVPIGGHKAAAIALVARQAEICLVSDLGEDFVRSLYLTPFGSLDDALTYAFGKYGEDARVTVMPYAGSTLPDYVGE